MNRFLIAAVVFAAGGRLRPPPEAHRATICNQLLRAGDYCVLRTDDRVLCADH